MSCVQIRGSNGVAYSPDRDLRQCYAQVVELAVARFNNNAWPELEKVVLEAGGSWDGLCDAMTSITNFLSAPLEDTSLTMEEMLKQSGWFQHESVDRVGVCAMFGCIMLGQLHHAVRETTMAGEAPTDLTVTAEKFRQLALTPTVPASKWKRFCNWLKSFVGVV